MDDLAAGVLVLALAGEGDREDLAPGALAGHVDRRVLHGQSAAEVAVDPLHQGVFLGHGPLGHQVVDVVGPVLDGRVPATAALLDQDLDDGRVQALARVDRRGAPFDVMDLRPFLDEDQGPLELAHVLGVDPEIGLERDVDLDAGRDVDERPARPDRRVEARRTCCRRSG